MKKRNVFSAALMSAILAVTACSDSEDKKTDVYIDPFDGFNLNATSTGSKLSDTEMDAMLNVYVKKVVYPTYEDMEGRVSTLNNIVETFIASNKQEDLNKACDAWRSAREPWEQSEAFLYGPADYGQLDPSLDSWPLDKGGIDLYLSSGDFSGLDDENNEEAQNLRGFHTAEYLLFDDGQNKEVGKMSDNQKKYLQRVVKHMLSDTKKLHLGWTSGLGNTDIPTSYGEALIKHDGTTKYELPNAIASIEMILNENNGMAGIANEVGTAKIADPVNLWKSGDKEGGVLAVESWYSWNSLTDYENNIISIENAYMGGRRGNRDAANSMSALVKKVNPTLDEMIQKQIKTTIEAIQDIPAPLRNNLDADKEIKAAQNACASLVSGLKLAKTALRNSWEK